MLCSNKQAELFCSASSLEVNVALPYIKNAAIWERPTALYIHWVENGNMEVR